jgi:hypothetical protein
VPAADHLLWKLEYPGWAPNTLNIGSLDGVPVDVSLYVYRIYSIGNRFYRVREACDSCVHPDYQGKGVFDRFYAMGKMREIEFDFRFRSTIHPRVKSTVKRYRPQHIELGSSLKAMVRPFASSDELAGHYLPAARSGLQRRILSAGISTARILRAAPWSSAPKNDRLEVRRVEDTDEILDLFDLLMHKIPRPSGLFQERSRNFNRWRYCDPRGGRSLVLFAFEKGKPAGVAVCKMSEKIGSLMDLLTDPARQDVASELVGAADDLLEEEGAVAIVCRVLDQSPLRKTLRAHRYIPSPLKTGCQLGPSLLSRAELNTLLKGRNHHLMMSDFDWA